MKENDFDGYVTDRYKDQIDWYDRKSQAYRRWYLAFQVPVVALAAVVPILIALGGTWQRSVALVISALVALGTTFLKTFKFQEHWVSYRTTCETLKKEFSYFSWDIGEYSATTNKKQLFVERVESLLSRENTKWLSMHVIKQSDSEGAKEGL